MAGAGNIATKLGGLGTEAVTSLRNSDTAKLAAAGIALMGLARNLDTPTGPDFSAFGTSLYFPNDLGSDKYPYYISFSFRKYERRSIYDRVFLKDTGMIRLPIPNQLVDNNNVDYSIADQSLIFGAGVENALKETKAISDWSTGQVEQIAQKIGNAAAGLGAGALVGLGTNNQTLQLAGLVQNPFLTVMFKSPTFKRHQFSWTLNPANPEESETMRSIINKFKYHQLPDIVFGAAAGTLLTYPDICLVGLYPSSRYLYDFKPCVIESMTVDYSSDGQPAFFGMTDAPVTAKIILNLLEIEYWTKNDILNPEYKL